jgi:hypothetical protein
MREFDWFQIGALVGAIIGWIICDVVDAALYDMD